MVVPIPPPSHTPASHTPDLAPFRRASLFRDLDEDVLARIAALARHRTWRGVEFIDGPSSRPSILIVGSGSLCLYRAAPTGDEVTLGSIGAGDIVPVAAAVGGEPSRTLARAQDQGTVVYRVPRAPLFQLLAPHPDVLIALIELLCEQLAASQDHVEDLALRTVHDRLKHALVRIADESKRGEDRIVVTRVELAARIGA